MHHPQRRKALVAAAVLSAALGFALPAAAQAPAAKAAEPLKIGFVYVSPIGDAGWTYQHDVGRKEME